MDEIRGAKASDAQALLNIYKEYINTPITFETELPSVSEFENRIRQISEAYPYLVYEAEGAVAAYAYAHRFKERAAYRFGAELSVYVSGGFTGRGIGGRLYEVLTELLKQQRVQTLYGCVTLPNERSVRLHRRLGFSQAGVFTRAGYKCGKWHDVAWFEKSIGAYEDRPPEILPPLDGAKMNAVLRSVVR